MGLELAFPKEMSKCISQSLFQALKYLYKIIKLPLEQSRPLPFPAETLITGCDDSENLPTQIVASVWTSEFSKPTSTKKPSLG